jgi:transcriptional regulator with XRE-family HTH domain
MTPAEFKAIRKSLGLSTVAMGRALGYAGNDNTVSVQIRQYESGGRTIPPWIARLVAMYGKHGVPEFA